MEQGVRGLRKTLTGGRHDRMMPGSNCWLVYCSNKQTVRTKATFSPITAVVAYYRFLSPTCHYQSPRMVAGFLFLTLFANFFSGSTGIECYSGLKLIAGQSVGTATINCGNSGSQCYNMTASAAAVIDLVKAGCSLWRCMLARDRCISTTFKSVPISLCCCSTERCNVNDNGVSMKQVGEWNAEPEHRGAGGEDQLTREEIRNRFASAEVDDDMPTHSPRGFRHG